MPTAHLLVEMLHREVFPSRYSRRIRASSLPGARRFETRASRLSRRPSIPSPPTADTDGGSADPTDPAVCRFFRTQSALFVTIQRLLKRVTYTSHSTRVRRIRSLQTSPRTFRTFHALRKADNLPAPNTHNGCACHVPAERVHCRPHRSIRGLDAFRSARRRYRRHLHRSCAGARRQAPTLKVLTTPAAPERGVMAGVRDILRRPGCRGRYRHRDPRHHARHQRAHRAQGRAHRAGHHRGLSRRARDGQREPLRPVRSQHRAARAAGPAPSAPAGAGAAGQ